MRPLRLELEGFGPYRERQAVDFSDVELFAITGPTGSGKSTLLDAIAFALYGQVPRAGRQVGTLKHPAAAKAWVSLTFRVGERVYRVERSRSEKRGDARVYLLEGGERLLDLPTLEAVNRALADLVGLDYEAFTRALLLPQGEFDRFLKGEPKERRQLLLELFELSRLERARQKAAERRGLLLEEKGRLEGELNGLSAATPEALEELERALAASRAEAARLEEEARGVRKALAEAEALLEDLRRRQALAARLEALKARAEEMARVEERLSRAEEAERALPLWRDYQKKRAALQATEKALEEAEGRLRALEARREALGFSPEALERAQAAYAEAQDLKALEALLARAPAGKAPASGPDPATAQARLEEVLKALEALGAELLRLRAWAEAWEALRAKEAALAEVGEALARLEAEGKEAREARDALALRLKEAEAHALSQALKALEAERKALEKAQEDLDRRREALLREERRLGLLAYHDLLEPGKPCPLCGGVVHALPPLPEVPDLAGARSALEEEAQALARRLARLEAEAGGLAARLRALEVEPRPGDPEALKGALEAAEARLQDLRDRYQALRGEARALEREVAALRAREAEARGGASREDLALRLEAAEARRLALEEEAGRLAAGLRRHLEAKTGGLGVGPYLRRLKEEVERLKGLAAEDARLREEAGALRAELSALRARKEEQAKALAEAEAATRGLMPEAEAQGLALSPGEREALRAELEAFRKDLAEAEAAWRSLPPLSGPAPTLEEAQGRVEVLRKALAELEGRLEEKRKEEGALEDRVERLRKDLARRREVEGALARLVAELALWEKLALDLQAHNFPAYLLGLKQRSLVERASELLYTLSGGRYRFAAQGDEYLVVDLWAEATPRQVRTLSGGESFLASLALALALSEELSRGKLEALFLDEGFGTLDPEALELVAGILESLPTRGRLVGVVTHVEPLAERFPARLRVRKHPWGSRVEWA